MIFQLIYAGLVSFKCKLQILFNFLKTKNKKTALLISTFFYVGFCKHAPGTLASAISIFFWIPIFSSVKYFYVRLLVFLLGFLIAYLSILFSSCFFRNKDAREIVIDEVIGMGLVLGCCEFSIQKIVIGFFLFRFFDIVKPWPICFIDNRMQTVFGILFDDIFSGFFTLAVFKIINLKLI